MTPSERRAKHAAEERASRSRRLARPAMKAEHERLVAALPEGMSLRQAIGVLWPEIDRASRVRGRKAND